MFTTIKLSYIKGRGMSSGIKYRKSTLRNLKYDLREV